jgi:hypothetical protein
LEKLVFKFVWDKIELVLTNISGIETPKQDSIAKKTQKRFNFAIILVILV